MNSIIKEVSSFDLVKRAELIIDQIASCECVQKKDIPQQVKRIVDNIPEHMNTWDQVLVLAGESLKQGWIGLEYYQMLIVWSSYPAMHAGETYRELIDRSVRGVESLKSREESCYLFFNMITETYFDVRPLLEEVKVSGVNKITEALDTLLSCYFKFKPHLPTRYADFDPDEAEALEMVRKLRAAMVNTTLGMLPEDKAMFMEDDWSCAENRISNRKRVFQYLKEVN